MSDTATVTVKVGELTTFMVAMLSSIGEDAYANIRGGPKKSDSEKEIIFCCKLRNKRYAGVIGIIPCWKMMKSLSLYPILIGESLLVYVTTEEGQYVQTIELTRDTRVLKELGYAQE